MQEPEVMPESFNPKTLVDVLRWRATRQPDQVVYTFLSDGATAEVSLTYGELDRQAQLIGAQLQALGAPAERVLLLYPPGLEYIAAFFGCLYAGMIAVPAYPPRRNRMMLRLQSIVADAQASVALTTAPVLSRIAPLFSQNPYLQPLRWLTTESLVNNFEREWQEPSINGDNLAFLQYTSGSTSIPKGVMVSHRNLLHNEEHIKQVFRQTEESVIVGWLPLYHDMGLIGNVLQPLYLGARCILMSPTSFLQSPRGWLEAISRYRATTSGGPNFAYDLCIRKTTPEQRARLDLSSWRVAFNGAEPIHHETLERFAAAFEPCGFNPSAFHPCYGLAEATLLVSGGGHDGRPLIKAVEAEALADNRVVEATDDREGARLLVGCGQSLPEHRVIVVNPERLAECAPDEVGEIWVAGQSVAGGYWNNAAETKETFEAYLADTAEGPFLRTGDWGFIRDGELFVTGRLKDLIIIRGRNHYPQDIERTVERCHPSLRPGCGAAFAVEISGEECLAIVQEVESRQRPDLDEVIRSIREAVSEEHELQTYAVVLLKPGSIAKTSSGKIQRHLSRTKFLERSLEGLAEWRGNPGAESEEETLEPAAPVALDGEAAVREWLVSHLAARLRIPASEIDVEQPITRYGLDSLMTIELKNSLEAGLGVRLRMSDLLQSHSIAQLAAQAADSLETKAVNFNALNASSETLVGHPLSRGQQSFWFLHQLASQSTANNIANAIRIRADLDTAALRRAFQSLCDRHPSLRTTFDSIEGQPTQHIHDHLELSFQEEDASTWSEALLHERLSEASRRSFDLELGPLLHVSLFRRSETEHVLLLVVHHIIVDFWSLAVLMQELSVLYEAEKNGEPVTLEPLALQYTDYVRWQEEMLSSAEGDRLWEYWQKQLAGDLPVLNLPFDRPHPAMPTDRGAFCSFSLNESLTRRLKALGRDQGATLYMTLLAAFYTLLYRYTSQTDIIVGSSTAGRNWGALSGVVGYFVNPVVLRARPAAQNTFIDFLRQVRETVLAAFEHQEYPFSLLVERLHPERSELRSPLFEVMFVFQKPPLLHENGLASFAIDGINAQMQLGDLTFESMALKERGVQFPLTLMVAENGEELAASFEYDTDLFDELTIERLASHFQILLAALAADPHQPISVPALISEAERRELLFEFNDTARDYQPHTSLHHMFEAQAERTPHAVALVHDTTEITYRELNQRADRLAQHLRRLGLPLEHPVAVCLPRSVDLVVSLLAVLKAGAAYLPLDPAYPQPRLRYMVEDAEASLLITHQHLRSLLPPLPLVICLDDEAAMAADPLSAEADSPPPVSPDNLAYIIYTSGSTGRPKGVCIRHRSAVTLLHWAHDTFSPTQLQCVLASTSVCFDLSVFELFVPLSCGGTVLLADNALSLPELAGRDRVTMINTVPSAMAELCRLRAIPDGVRVVNLAGEALKRGLVEEVYASGSGVEAVYNLYGPTEDTTYTTWEMVARGGEGEPSIGRPVANTQVYILDEELRVVPTGGRGEIYIGGDGLARGYMNQPGLTAEKFVPDPYGQVSGGRLYRTGDVGRHLRDGRIDYLGRGDQQVKVRGYRIELGEIEAALAEHEGVREAVVVVREEGEGEKRLVAYVVLERGGQGSQAGAASRELQRYIRERLPEYMVPAVIVELDEMPLTVNGKVDRLALPAPEWYDERGRDFIAARTPVEEMLTAIWSEVLGVGQIGVSDNFFDLGGHSLLATQVVSRVRTAFSVDVALRQLFKHPVMADFALVIESALRLEGGTAQPPITPVGRDGLLPLSFAQQRLWFIDQLEPDSPLYNLSWAVSLTGRLDLNALSRTFSEIIRRHEVLRTTFIVESGQPVQLIHAPQLLSMPLTDLSALAPEMRHSQMQNILAEEAQRPFDLAVGALIRVRLLKMAETEHVVVLTMHHIVADGWSVGVLVGEVAALYGAFVRGEESPLEELAVQYADYALWQREWLQGAALDEQLDYWREQLAGAPAVLELPTDRVRPAKQTYRGARERFELSEELVRGLREVSRQEGVTLFMLLMAGWQTLLYRYSGQTDVLVGTPIANRTRRETEPLVGFFVNTLVIRCRFAGESSFTELLKQVRDVALGAYTHQDVPFEKLVEELQPERSLSHSPLFQVMFILQNAPLGSLEMPELRLSPVVADGSPSMSKFDLTLEIQEAGASLDAALEYNTDLFEKATIERMTERFRMLLASIVADRHQSLSDIPLLTEAERRQTLVEWNETRADYPQEACVHSLFELQAERTPEATALEFQGQRLTYAELNARANQLAHHLRGLGVGAEVLVGICVERSIDLVVGLLGILKSGGAYVPLDPAYPQERLALMLSDAGVPVLLTQESLRGRFDEHQGTVMYLDTDREAISSRSTSNPPRHATPDNLAYTIYTSGSTGRPKGVCIRHRSAVTLLHWAHDTFSPAQLQCVLASTSVCFDLSVFELFVPLSCGGTVLLADNALSLPELAGRDRVTMINTVPSAMAELCRLRAIPDGVRVVNLAGEALKRGLVEEVYESGSGVEAVYNLYGPTEDTTYTTWELVTRGAEGEPSIGRPVANTQVYILDEEMRVVPTGGRGEIYIGGDGLARGYLRRGGQTAERFVPHPYAVEAGERLYRTGDVGRYGRDGKIEYLGREDQQVKVRGYRIELGEIEAALAEHEGVREAVVVVREEREGEKRLVAYVVLERGAGSGESSQGVVSGELRAYVRERLPEYMVPAVIVELDEMPLTVNGKVDRLALPAPSSRHIESGAPFHGANTAIEDLLAGIWAQLLDVERVGMTDNFFLLGGHSLLATQLISRLRHIFHIDLPLRSIFLAPTPSSLARLILNQLAASSSSLDDQLAPIPHLPDPPPILSYAQHRLWFLDQLDGPSSTYIISGALRLRGALSTDTLCAALSEVVRRHETLRTTFISSDEGPRPLVHAPAPVPLPIVDLSALPAPLREQEAHRLITLDARTPFDLGAGPLLRATLVKLDEGEHIFLFAMHHIISDGWSIGVLVREVTTLYAAYRRGAPSPLEELRVQYRDYAAWQRERLEGGVLEEQLEYWRKQLAGAPATLRVGGERLREGDEGGQGEHIRRWIGAELTAKLRRMSGAQGVTLFMLLLGVFKTLLWRHSGETDVVVGTPIAGRTRVEVEGLIGFFVNIQVMRTQVRGDEQVKEMLERVREVCLGAYAHQDVPFERVVEEMEPERVIGRTPLFQVYFVLQNAPGGELVMEGVQVEAEEVKRDRAKFELSLAIEEESRAGGGMRVEWEFQRGVYENWQVEAMSEQYERMLEKIVEEGGEERKLRELEMLSEAERRELLFEFNDTARAYESESCIHELFEAQAARTPEAIALVYEGEE
ncbi:MAG TPA: amino acid adenylation domain-containing protein, partial [Pyrinomonadaceae bacterium]|nr:amino acid adenylation domain-containing protein [Pyrinomonadaceae bacterium]